MNDFETPVETEAAPANVIGTPTLAEPNPDAPRAPVRGVYEDQKGERRVIAAGDVIPDGWTELGDSRIEDREAATFETGGVADALPASHGAGSALIQQRPAANGDVDQLRQALEQAADELEDAELERDAAIKAREAAEAQVSDLEQKAGAARDETAQALQDSQARVKQLETEVQDLKDDLEFAREQAAKATAERGEPAPVEDKRQKGPDEPPVKPAPKKAAGK